MDMRVKMLLNIEKYFLRLLLPYFVEFFKNGSILEKDYSDDCAIEGPNQKPIIIIIYDKSKILRH